MMHGHSGGISPIAEMIRQLGAQGTGDTVLAHINPREAAMLQAAGGSGRPNPATGLPSFDDRGDSGIFASPTQIAAAGFDPDRTGRFLLANPNIETAGTRQVQGQTVNIANRIQSQGGTGRALEGTSILPAAQPAPAPAPAPVAAPVAPAPAPVAPRPAPAPAPTASPIAQAIIGAINQSSGDTGSGVLNPAAVRRAGVAGTTPDDLVFSIDNSRQRTRSRIIDGASGL